MNRAKARRLVETVSGRRDAIAGEALRKILAAGKVRIGSEMTAEPRSRPATENRWPDIDGNRP